MPSKYPSVTAKPQPKSLIYYPKGSKVPVLKPQVQAKVDKMMMGFLSPQAERAIAIAKLPKALRVFPRLRLVVPDQGTDPAFIPVIKPGSNAGPDPAIWTYTPCGGCSGSGDFYRQGSSRSSRNCCATLGQTTAEWAAQQLTQGYGFIESWMQTSTYEQNGQTISQKQMVGYYFNDTVPGAPLGTVTSPKAFAPGVFPLEFPLAAPMARPISAPFADPRPVPLSSPYPGEEPSEKEEPAPAFAPDTAPLVVPYPGTPFARPGLKPGLPPITFPGTVVRPGPAFPGPKPGSPEPGPELEVEPSTDFGRPRPPVPVAPSAPGKAARTVEKKANVALVGGVVWTGLNTTTEVFDFVKAMHNSIPKGKHRLSSKASKAQVLEYMFTNIEPWKHIDLAEALQNYINMQIGDYVSAFGSNQIKRVSQELGILTGLDRVLRAHSDNLGEAGNWSENVPTLDIDMETGVISVIGPLGALRLKLGGRR